ENGFEHLRRGLAIDTYARFDGFQQVDRLLERNQCPDANLGKTLDSLDDDFDVLPLFMGRSEELEVAQFREHPPQFGLEQDQDGEDKNRGKGGQEVLQHLEFEKITDEAKGEEYHQESRDDGRSPRAAHETEGIINAYRENENLDGRPPAVLQKIP